MSQNGLCDQGPRQALAVCLSFPPPISGVGWARLHVLCVSPWLKVITRGQRAKEQVPGDGTPWGPDVLQAVPWTDPSCGHGPTSSQAPHSLIPWVWAGWGLLPPPASPRPGPPPVLATVPSVHVRGLGLSA